MISNIRSLSLRQRALLTITLSVLFLLSIAIGSFLFGEDELAIQMQNKNSSPSLSHWFGTDWLGRDMFARTVDGLALSLGVGLLASSISVVIALILSLLTMWSEWADRIVTWFIDLFLSVPHLVLLILISFSLGGGFKGVVLGLAFTHWPSLTRILRGEILQMKTAEYVGISKQLGKSKWWVARYHFLPHLIPQLFVGFLLMFPHAILHEASITFLGFGLPAEQPAIGVILSESMRYLSVGMWWLAFFPGLSLLLMVGIFDRLGHSLQKLLDPFQGQKR
ncbi:ABC transporter permease [Oceanobacillus piezotolerans]|uniref:ABC transporter permease n=1 Tax=Oceanobacillus piezotolerans TaxID=2448030 RepID=A0A498D339_9BACI|nr:ABC transporter permease [Oceanobacillus piezotolerans]RLL42093.1 ABC transporter permease [Oceanobacillus piezotolerans]